MSGTGGQRKRQSHASAHGGKPVFVVQFLRFQSEEDDISATSRLNRGRFHAARDANHLLLVLLISYFDSFYPQFFFCPSFVKW